MSDITSADIGLRSTASGGGEDSREDPNVKYWIGQIDEALKREKDYRKLARDFVRLYEGDKAQEFTFNILYSNTETMAPALFNSTPRPVVKRRHHDNDPLGMLAAKTGERLLTYLLDDGGRETPDFASTFNDVVTAGLVPGRGIPWVKYDPVFEVVPATQAASDEAAEGVKEASPSIDPNPPAPTEAVSDEYICVDSVEWDDFVHGYATSWQKVPWIAVRAYLDREELIKLAGDIGKEVRVVERKVGSPENEDESSSRTSSDDGNQGLKTAEVWSIWDKRRRKVFYVCREYLAGFLKDLADPLELDGFYPCPEPLRFFRRLNNLLPQPPYVFYKEQARELNAVTTRINKIVRALKVRGFYDNALGDDLKKLLEAEDNSMIPVDGAKLSATQMNGSSLDKAIWLMPLEKLIAVLQQLYLQRTQIKQVIYEIMGLSDILRGSSAASETATAQEIKAEWGGLRLKRSQKAVMTCVRDTLRIMLEIAVSQFDAAKIRSMTGMPLPLAEEKAQQVAQLQEFQMSAQPDPQTGQPQQPPPDLVAATQLPTMEDVLKLLRDDLQRSYRIDVETNSTIDAEATEDKKDIAEMMNAMAQFLSGVQPMVENGTLPFEAAQAMLLAVTRRYRFGTEVEEQLLKMKPPQPAADPKAEADKAKLQGDLELQKVKIQGEQAKTAQQMELMRLEVELEKERLQIEREKLNMEREKLMLQRDADLLKISTQKQMAHIDMQKARMGLVQSAEAGQMKLNQAEQMGQVKLKQAKQPPAGNPRN